MNTFFTSDLHFGHQRIIELCNRPFESVEHQDETLIANWNSVVKETSEVWVVGDFSHRLTEERNAAIFNSLNGKKHLIIGNHDNYDEMKKLGWESIHNYKELKLNRKKIILSHYPFEEWNGFFRGTWHLHGHVHSTPTCAKLKDIPGRWDVGVDRNNYYPISFEEIESLLTT